MRMDAKKAGMLKDFITNIIAAVIPIAILQILVFPQLAKIVGNEGYGIIVTIIGIITLFSDSYGNALNNVRLLQNDEYREEGDFNLILAVGVAFNIITVYVGYSCYGLDNDGIFWILLSSVLILVRAYYIVTFRLELYYKKILINNVFLAIGYVVGFGLFLKIDNWTLIYSCGNILSLIHLFFNSKLMREPFRKTSLLKKTIKKTIVLYIANLLQTFTNYADKLLIFPMLGAEAVAYYYAASVMGKMMSMVISPISSVILSYVVKAKSLSKYMINKILLLIIGISGGGFIFAYLIGKFLLKLLYNSWFDIVIDLLPWTVFAAIFSGMASVIQPFILKFKSELYQIVVNSLYIIMYVLVSFILTKKYGLVGFGIGYCVTMLIKFLINLFLLKSIGKESDKNG